MWNQSEGIGCRGAKIEEHIMSLDSCVEESSGIEANDERVRWENECNKRNFGIESSDSFEGRMKETWNWTSSLLCFSFLLRKSMDGKRRGLRRQRFYGFAGFKGTAC